MPDKLWKMLQAQSDVNQIAASVQITVESVCYVKDK